MFSQHQAALVNGWKWHLLIVALWAWFGPKSLPAKEQSVQDACSNITDEERTLYRVIEVDWVPAGTIDKSWPTALTTLFSSPPASYENSYCSIIFTLGDGGATVSLDGGYLSFVDGSFAVSARKNPGSGS